MRPRTLLYLALLALVSAIMLVAWMRRTVLDVNVLSDRNPPYVRLSDGGVRNGYTVKILNKLHEPRTFQLAVRGLAGARLTVVGLEGEASPGVRVGTDDLREVRVLVTVPRASAEAMSGATVPFEFVIRDAASGHETVRATRFQRM
jgi:polyferredoxin